MTKTIANTDFTVDQIITIAPQSNKQYVVVAIDDLSDDMIYVEAVNGLEAGKWVFTTYCAPVEEQEDASE